MYQQDALDASCDAEYCSNAAPWKMDLKEK